MSFFDYRAYMLAILSLYHVCLQVVWSIQTENFSQFMMILLLLCMIYVYDYVHVSFCIHIYFT